MLKGALAAAVLVLLAAAQARAGILITGAIRDRGGSAVAGARVSAFDAAGRPVGSDVASADGTFAIDAAAQPATIGVACDYCRPERAAVVPSEPVVVIVDRSVAVAQRGPSADDVRALPYRSAEDVASLEPFTVVTGDRIADRDLDRYGAVTVGGLPFSDPADGSSAAPLIPAHAISALTVASPLNAPLLGGYATAGVYGFALDDAGPAAGRADLGDASDVVLRANGANGSAVYAASSDAGDDRQAFSVGANTALGSGRLSMNAVDLAADAGHAQGAGVAYAADGRRFGFDSSLDLTQIADSSLVSFGAQVRAAGLPGAAFGVRALRAAGVWGGAAAAQFDGAAYAVFDRRIGAGRIRANVAWDHGSDAGAVADARAAALTGSLAGEWTLTPHWWAAAGAVSNLRIPTFAEAAAAAPAATAADRSGLVEGSLSYTDLRRLRLTATAYTQRTTGPAALTVTGAGVDGAWQFAPAFSLRAWLLAAHEASASPPYEQDAPFPAYAGIGYGRGDSPALEYPAAPGAPAANLAPGLLWLTYDRWIRVDALVRGGGLEGDVRIPFGALDAFTLGSARTSGRRVTTFGLTLR